MNRKTLVQCIICDIIANLVHKPGWSVLVPPHGWGSAPGLPGQRCPDCMKQYNSKQLSTDVPN